MTDRPARPNLLPSSASALERALVDVDGRLDEADLAFVTRVRDPAETPAAYLPYLAWERSVDVWDPAWPEDVQRAVIAAAPIVHRYKGTRYGVRTALEALGVAMAITEWWQTAPVGVPYTFRLVGYARQRLYDGSVYLDDRLIRAIFDTVMRTKPLSRAFTLAVGAGFPAPLGTAAASAGQIVRRAALHPRFSLAARSAAGLAAASAGRIRAATRVQSRPWFLASGAAVAGGAGAAGRLRVSVTMKAVA